MFVIIDVSENVYHHAGEKIPAARRPSYIHSSRDDAERELLRLQQKHVGEFVLFEAVAEAVPTMTDRTVFLVEPSRR